MKREKRIVALAVALVLLLIPVLALADDVDLALGSIDITSTGYTVGTTSTTFSGEGTHTVNITNSSAEGTTSNTVTVRDTASTVAVTMSGNYDYSGADSLLTVSGDVDDLTLKDATLAASGSGSVVSVASEADVELKMENTVVYGGTSDAAVQVDGDVNISASDTCEIVGGAQEPALDIGASGVVTVSDGTLEISGNFIGGAVTGDEGSTLAAADTGVVVVENTNSDMYIQPVQGVDIDGTQETHGDRVDAGFLSTIVVRAAPDPSNTPERPLPKLAGATTITLNLNGDLNETHSIPIGDADPNNLLMNGVSFEPDIAPGNCIELVSGDALMATLINDDPQFFEGLEVGEPPIKENIVIQHGNAYISLSDGSHVNLYEQVAKSTFGCSKNPWRKKVSPATRTGTFPITRR